MLGLVLSTEGVGRKITMSSPSLKDIVCSATEEGSGLDLNPQFLSVVGSEKKKKQNPGRGSR